MKVENFEMLGVAGTLTRSPGSCGIWIAQKWKSERRTAVVDGQKVLAIVEVRFDDECRNGHNSFSITCHGWYDHYKSRDWDFGGCCHEIAEAVFPELAHLIKWHLTSSKGPMHYVANTLYLAGDRDYNGLRKGETKPRLAKGGVPMWELVADVTGCKTKTPVDTPKRAPVHRVETLVVSHEKPAGVPTLRWEQVMQVGEGKERQLDAARRTAVWPDATDEQLCLPRAELEDLLMKRLQALLEDFRKDVEAAGLLWTCE